MSLQTQIAADASGVFLQTDEFAQSVTRNIGGDTNNTESVTAIVDLDDEESQQGTEIDNERGKRISRFGRLEILSSISVTTNEAGIDCDTFTISGEKWCAIRVEGRDGISGLQTVIIRRDEKVFTKRPSVLR